MLLVNIFFFYELSWYFVATDVVGLVSVVPGVSDVFCDEITLIDGSFVDVSANMCEWLSFSLLFFVLDENQRKPYKIVGRFLRFDPT